MDRPHPHVELVRGHVDGPRPGVDDIVPPCWKVDFGMNQCFSMVEGIFPQVDGFHPDVEHLHLGVDGVNSNGGECTAMEERLCAVGPMIGSGRDTVAVTVDKPTAIAEVIHAFEKQQATVGEHDRADVP